jgi:hypothetical protein
MGLFDGKVAIVTGAERGIGRDEAQHVTGQVFRAVGDEIAHYIPWKVGSGLKAGRQPQRWQAEKIGDAVNTNIFGSTIGGLQMGG